MRVVLLLATIFFSLDGATLYELIDKALQDAPSLEIIKHGIETKQQDVASADLFANPTLAITKNTLPSDQAMSQATVTLGQVL